MNALWEEVTALISREGPIPFAEFMRLALYHPEHGYYARRVPGEDAGYATAPTLSPVFGRLVARALDSMWDALGRPEAFVVVEAGGGRGDLAAEALAATRSPLRWVLVEPHERVRALQRERLRGVRAEWAPSLRDVTPVAGCVLANEVLDNFPLHVLRGGRELHVGLDDGRLDMIWSVPSLAAPSTADVVELRPSVAEWVADAAAVLDRGYLVVVDYGYETAPGRSTLLAYDRGVPIADPLVRPGDVDITAHVDFGALRAAVLDAGLDVLGLVGQSGFLHALGLADELARLRDRESPRDTAALLAHAERTAASLLAAPGRLGDFKVLVAGKDAPPLAFLEEAESARSSPADGFPGYVLEVVDDTP